MINNLTEKDLITTDRYLNLIDEYPNLLSHIKPDYFIHGNFTWRGKNHPERILKNVIISHSDYGILNKYCTNFDNVFCTNNLTENLSNVYSLPLGLPNYNSLDNLPILKIIGNKTSIIKVINEEYNKNILLLINFNTSTFPSERNFLIEKLSNISEKFTLNYTENGYLEYLRSIKKSKFVLCPRGNGIDTHRLWETLYMGSIPIIKYEKTYETCIDLPVVFINDWSEITIDFLNSTYEKMSHSNYNFEKLKMNYWYNFILSKLN